MSSDPASEGEPVAPTPPRQIRPVRKRRWLLWVGVGFVPATMVAVSGAGVLVSLALPSFRDYVMRERAAEAASFLGEIRLREEAYRAEFYEYCSTDPSPAVLAPGGELQAFDAGARGWAILGAAPDGPVRFRYRVITGAHGADVPGADGRSHAFVMQAEADLDGDGDVMAVEGYPGTDELYFSRGVGGPPLDAGWE